MKHTALFKLCTSLLLAVGTFLCVQTWDPNLNLDFSVAWVVFAFSYIGQSLVTFFQVKSNQIAQRCKDEDLSSWLLFVFLLLTCSVALVSISAVQSDRFDWKLQPLMATIICISAVAFAWLLVHVSFTFRYAHLYYGDDNKLYTKHTKGLDFPEDDAPDYLDFAYYSFTVGMTFQVSDVVIRNKAIRRLTLIHSLISFVFNTVIIALTINGILNLK